MQILKPALLAAALLATAGCKPVIDEPPASASSSSSPGSAAVMGAAPAPRGPAVAPASSPTAAPAVNDAQITARVQAEIAAARDMSGVRIDVDTREGVVTLSGAVRSAAIKARASEIARAVRGVQDVNDQLTLATS